MLRLSDLCRVSLLSLVYVVCAFSDSTPRCQKAACSARAPASSVAPQGAIDGRNTSSRLSHTPIADTLILVFPNGISLVENEDFLVAGQVRRLSPLHVPPLGDNLRVTYSPV